MKFGADIQDDYEDENLYEVSGRKVGAGAERGQVCGEGWGGLLGLLLEAGWGQGTGPRGTEAHHPVSSPGPEP